MRQTFTASGRRELCILIIKYFYNNILQYYNNVNITNTIIGLIVIYYYDAENFPVIVVIVIENGLCENKN
jgi:hypothetical protein